MRKLIFSVLLFLIYMTAFSQSNNYDKEMLTAITIHDNAKDVKTEIKALNAFEDLEEKYPTEWLPSYWASYLCSQIARLEGQMDDFPKDKTGKYFLVKSREHLELSKKKNKNPSDVEKSNLLMLDGFIYSFYPSIVGITEKEKTEFNKISSTLYKEAAILNSLNFNLLVLKAIKLGRSDDYQNKVAALGLFDYTIKRNEQETNRALTTFWASDFIGFWKGQTEESLEELYK